MSKSISKNRVDTSSSQLELSISRPLEKDRNFNEGGRSFYFFDFDDNVAVLTTPIYIFHKTTNKELRLTSGEFAQIHSELGRPGIYEKYEIRIDDQTGSFRNFRDKNLGWIDRLLGRKQFFLRDLAEALGFPDYQWKGPSWSCFYHAVYNKRPLSLITARGHAPATLQEGIKLFIDRGYIPHEPNYLSIFPVSHPTIRQGLSTNPHASTAELKRAAIRASFHKAIQEYGLNSKHRFGMSDDDPKNIQIIVEEMSQLKKTYSEMSFFVISTQHGDMIKREVFSDHTEDMVLTQSMQLKLF